MTTTKQSAKQKMISGADEATFRDGFREMAYWRDAHGVIRLRDIGPDGQNLSERIVHLGPKVAR